jgi:hypothetical protein
MIVVMALVGITLGSYLQLVSQQNLSIMRSMAWTSALAVAEAGVEEAMAHINRNNTNRVLDSWTEFDPNPLLENERLGASFSVGTSPVYVMRQRPIGNSKFKVYITRDLDPPIIFAEGYARHPMNQSFLPRPRILRVTTATRFLFIKGMVAKGTIDLSGNNIKTDSFDSRDPLYSTDGKYDPDKTKDNGDVATNSSMVDSLGVWNAEVYGRVATGPGGAVRMGANGAVGSKAWHDAGNVGIEEGYSSADMNVHFPDVREPFSGGGFSPAPAEVDGTNYTYVVGNGNWQMNTLSLSGSDGAMLVNGHAVLYVTGEVDLTGQSYIYIAPGASLQLYVAGENANLGGNGVVNADAKASDFTYWGLPSNTQVSMTGNAAFTGTIYAPQASLTLGGGGSSRYDFVGATVTDKIRMNGHFQFHYDEALQRFGPRDGYTVVSWNEATYDELYSLPGL